MISFKEINCVILAGGQSSRMGVNKSFLKLGNQYIIERLVSSLDSLFNEVAISTNSTDDFKFLNKKIIHDIFPSVGPLSGVHAGLFNSHTQRTFFISCDLPFVDIRLINYLIHFSTQKEIVLPVIKSIPQYDCGIYCKSLVPKIESLIVDHGEKASLKKLINLESTELISAETLPFYREELFLNMNTPEDYKTALKISESRILE